MREPEFYNDTGRQYNQSLHAFDVPDQFNGTNGSTHSVDSLLFYPDLKS